MSICEQRIDSDGIYVRLSGGQEISWARGSLRTLVQQEGTKLKALLALRQNLRQLVGSQLDMTDLTIDFAIGDGTPLALEWKAR